VVGLGLGPPCGRCGPNQGQTQSGTGCAARWADRLDARCCFACTRSMTAGRPWCALARERARVATPEKAAAASQRLVEPLTTRRPRKKGKDAAEVTAALAVLEATPSPASTSCGARTAGLRGLAATAARPSPTLDVRDQRRSTPNKCWPPHQVAVPMEPRPSL